jgi:hypothetical protein
VEADLKVGSRERYLFALETGTWESCQTPAAGGANAKKGSVLGRRRSGIIIHEGIIEATLALNLQREVLISAKGKSMTATSVPRTRIEEELG